MNIKNYYKKNPLDKHMTLDLVFQFVNEPNPKIVELPYTKESLANAMMICNTEMETFLFLDECNRQDQWKKFEVFIHQATEDYMTSVQSQSLESRKRCVQFRKPTVVELDG